MCLHLHSCSFNDMACLRASAVRDLERNLSHTMGNGWPSKLFNPQSHQRLGSCEKPVEIINNKKDLSSCYLPESIVETASAINVSATESSDWLVHYL